MSSRSVQNHLARHSESGKKTRQTEQEVWEDNIREWTGLQFAKSQRAEEKKEEKKGETGCEFIYGALTTLAVKG